MMTVNKWNVKNQCSPFSFLRCLQNIVGFVTFSSKKNHAHDPTFQTKSKFVTDFFSQFLTLFNKKSHGKFPRGFLHL